LEWKEWMGTLTEFALARDVGDERLARRTTIAPAGDFVTRIEGGSLAKPCKRGDASGRPVDSGGRGGDQ